MSAPDTYAELPSFMAPGAFALVRTGHDGILYNPDMLGDAVAFINAETDAKLPDDPTLASFVYRFGEGGFERPDPDPNFHKANPAALYVPAGQLALGPEIQAATVAKAEIRALRRPVVQVQMMEDLGRPLIGALASTVIYNPAEDHRMLASPAAWARQFKIALGAGARIERNNKRIVSEVSSRFAGAIVLNPRRPKAA